MTALLFRDDAYRKSAPVTVNEVREEGVVLDSTILYAQGGG